MTTEVKYHRDYGRVSRPAINVKLQVPGRDLRSPEVDAALDVDEADNIHEAAFERVAADFWSEAADQADELGLGRIEQEGRSGGWLVIASGDPDEIGGDSYHATKDDCRAQYVGEELAEHLALRAEGLAERVTWLTAYTELREWCEAWLRSVPHQVREMAQSIAIDQIAGPAAHRMWSESSAWATRQGAT